MAETCDILISGGGIAGLTAAAAGLYFWGQSTAVVAPALAEEPPGSEHA